MLLGILSLKHVDIPKSVIEFDGAFRNCSSLASVNIADGVTTIGYDTFNNCTSLTSVSIPNSVTVIGSSAFCNCIYNHRTTKTNQKYPSVNL